MIFWRFIHIPDYRFDNKPKNDDYYQFDKPKNDYQYSQPERGGCLSVFLGFIFLANVLAMILLVILFGADNPAYVDDGLFNIIIVVGIGFSVLALVCVYSLWSWKQWGYNGLMFFYVASIVLNLMASDLPSAGGSVAGFSHTLFPDER